MAVSRSTVTSKKTPAKVPAIKAQASQAAPTPKHAAAITTKRKTAAAAPSTSTDKGKKRARQEIEEDTVALPSDSQEDDSDDDFSAIEDLESASEVDSDDDEDEADSSDEEEEEQQDEKYKAGGKAKKVSFDTKQLPEVNKQAKKGERQQQKKSKETGVIYLGRIPHGFHEAEMRSYFSQFGDVTRLRLSRNKKTGASKHYAFIEFAHESVAEIVQETMDNYLLSGHILVCKIVPRDKVHPRLWVGANRRFRPVPKARLHAVKHNAPKSDAQKERITRRLVAREQARRDKIAKSGIDYDFDGYAAQVAAIPPTEKKSARKAKTASAPTSASGSAPAAAPAAPAAKSKTSAAATATDGKAASKKKAASAQTSAPPAKKKARKSA